MRNRLLPLALAGAMSLGGCAYAGFAPLVAQAVEQAARPSRYTAEDFGPAAAEACRGRAARHGRVEITKVEPNDSNSMRVYGTIEDPYGGKGRSFACVLRSDGNMPYFRLS